MWRRMPVICRQRACSDAWRPGWELTDVEHAGTNAGLASETVLRTEGMLRLRLRVLLRVLDGLLGSGPPAAGLVVQLHRKREVVR